MKSLRWLSLLGLLLLPSAASAQDLILLQEVIPQLEGTELGLIELGSAPPPGSARTVHRGEMIAAIRASGKSLPRVRIPSAVRIVRRARELDRDEIEDLARPLLREALGSCDLGRISAPRRVRIGVGEERARIELSRPIDGSDVAATLIVEVRGRETRLPLRASVRCPPPVIAPGQRLRIVVVVGNVRATAPAEARQPGRVGDVIRIRNLATGASALGRVIDPETVELAR